MSTSRAFLVAVLAGTVTGVGCGARSSLDLPLRVLEGLTDGGYGGSGGSGGGENDGGAGGSGQSGGTSSGRGSSGTSSVSGTGESGVSGTTSPFGGSTGCGGTGREPPSCAPGGPGMTNCGPCNESCCRSVDVVGGNFFRTYTNTGQGPSGEADPASISGLRIDKYLVTVGRFRQFVRAWNEGSGYTPSAGAGKHAHLNSGQGLAAAGSPGMFEPGWVAIDDSWINPTDANLLGCPATTWTPAPGANENLPMNCIDWWEAYAFCIWDDAFLPSEAELGYVEAGGSDQREYPWGATAPGTNNEYAIFGYVRHGEVGCHYPETGRCTGAANIASVGAAKAGAGRWSQLDLTGDVGEWALDWFSAYDDPCTDCAQLDAVQTRVIRGAAYDSVEANLAPAFRDGRYPPGRNGDVGLRCARTP